jgi:ABC-type multidrug transport system fused ATPase/permease subunit
MDWITDFIIGILLGFFSSFFVIYSLQPQRPYPEIVLNILYHPWILVIVGVSIIAMFAIEERIALILLLIIVFFLIDIYFFRTRKKYFLNTRELHGYILLFRKCNYNDHGSGWICDLCNLILRRHKKNYYNILYHNR